MSTTIMDGTGTNRRAKVNSDSRLLTEAVIITELSASTEDGNTFIVASDFVTLSDTGSFSGVFYFKNTSADRDYHIDSLRTCNDSFTYWKIKKNVSTGTLVSGGAAAPVTNGDLNLSTVPTCTALTGSNGATVTDGTLMGTHMQGAGHSTQEWKGGVDLPPGASMSIECKPTAAGDVCIQMVCISKPAGEV